MNSKVSEDRKVSEATWEQSEEKTSKGNSIAEKDSKKQRMINDLGYGKNLPKALLKKHLIEIECPAGSVPKLKLTKTMLIMNVGDGVPEDTLDLGDWIIAVNDIFITSREQYREILNDLIKINQKHTIKYTIKRTVRTIPISQTSNFIPQAIEIPEGCSYYLGYLTMYPGSSLGLNIKSYNYKVFVTSTDNGFRSLGKRTFRVGDAILSVDGREQTSIAETSNAILDALNRKKHVSMVIERAESGKAIENMRLALMTQKTIEIDPRMTDDVIEICNAEISRMKTMPQKIPPGIYKAWFSLTTLRKMVRTKSTVAVANKSKEIPIGMDSINPILLQRVPAPPGPRRTKFSPPIKQKAKVLPPNYHLYKSINSSTEKSNSPEVSSTDSTAKARNDKRKSSPDQQALSKKK